MTLPTPKQELVANFINLKFQKVQFYVSVDQLIYQVSMKSAKIHNLNLEWLWRLKFDTKEELQIDRNNDFIHPSETNWKN